MNGTDFPVNVGAGAADSFSDGFGSNTENTVLRDRIGAEIAAHGPLPFRRFMELALYDPAEGYYNTRPAIGYHGDYVTSPELHPFFGALVARQLHEFWQLLGEPAIFRLVEAGAGSGALARSILATAPLGLRERLAYVIVEPSARRAAQQRSTLGALADRCRWAPQLEDAAAGDSACVLSNELFDSFPVHRVRVRDGRLYELLVGLEVGRFVDVLGAVSTPAISTYYERLQLLPGEGCEAEINLDATAWMRRCARAVQRGFVLTLDYGYPARLLYAPWRQQGTLLCFYQHTVATDPYVHVGRQDLTAHVDFTSLAAAGREQGLMPVGFTSQQRFLADLGIADVLAGGPSGAIALEEYLARRRAVEALLDPQGLGRVRVLAQAKGVEIESLCGFRSGSVEELDIGFSAARGQDWRNSAGALTE